MVVGENKRTANIMDGIENTGDVRLHDHRLRLKQRFDIVRKLGQGTYGKVQLGINKKTGQEVAIKTIKKCKIESEADLIRIRREVQIMSSVRHPNIVHIYEVFENSEKMILVMEYCSGGELYDYLSQKKVLQEDEARRLFRQIATAVYYCHIHKICHRDLKLENVLLDDTGSAKIADFGLSNVFKETSLLSTFCGSPLYASPEIVKGTPYIGPEVDCWSLGVLLYTLVYGAMPFDGSNFKRLVRQISNGDYYEPKSPSSASPLIRDMLTVDPLKRADIAYICDHPWVNTGCETSCLEMAEALAAETPVRLDLLLSLAPAAPSNSNSVVVPAEAELGPEESCTDLTSSASMAVEPSNSAEKRILELVAEGGEDAIKPSPTRTIVSAGDNKRKLELAMSASGLQKKKERVASSASIAPQPPAVPEESPADAAVGSNLDNETAPPQTLKTSATITIGPAPSEPPADTVSEPPASVTNDKPAKPRLVIKKKATTPKATEDKVPEKQDDVKEEAKPSAVSTVADKLTSLSVAPAGSAPATAAAPAPAPSPATAPAPAPTSPPAATPAPAKPKKLSIPGGNVGNFKDQFERRASLTAAPEPKRTVTKPVVSKIAKPKAQSEDRELPKAVDNGTVRLQQIGIEPSPQKPSEESSMPRGGVKKTESEPSHSSAPMDPSALLQDARRSLQNSMAKLAEEKAGEEGRKRARDIISTYIRAGKPPVPYGRSSSAGVTALLSPPGTPPAAAPATAPTTAPTRVFRTEAQHRVEDHRPRGVSVERIIPIHVAGEDSPTSPPQPPPYAAPQAPLSPPTPKPAPRAANTPIRRLVSSESCAGSEAGSTAGEPIKKSAREFIIPIAVEGKGYVTPRQRSLEPEAGRPQRAHRPARRISSLVSGGESEEEDDTHMHRLRSTRAARAESVSSGEEDEEDEGFHLLTAENLFSTLLHRVRALTQRLNGEEGPGFPQHPHSLFNNLQSPFFNSPHLPRRHLLREGWGSRDRDFDSMFSASRQQMPRGSSKKSGKHQTKAQQNTETNAESGLDLSDLDLSSIKFSEAEMRALSGLTPALSRRLQQQLLAHLPPAAARDLRRTLSLHTPSAPPAAARPPRSVPTTPATPAAGPDDPVAPQYCTLPRLKRQSATRDTASTSDTTPSDGKTIVNSSTDISSSRDTSSSHVEQSAKISREVPDVNLTRDVRDKGLSRDARDVSLSQDLLDVTSSPDSRDSVIPQEERNSSTIPRETRDPTVPRDSTISRETHESTIPPETRDPIIPREMRDSTLTRETRGPTLSPETRELMLPRDTRDTSTSRGSSSRATPERPLLSKYLAGERAHSLDESLSSSVSESGSILSEPSYVAAYGTPATPGLTFRRHSMRLAGDQPRKRISRFLRPDFFDSPPDENVYVKHKKEKELETQKILREIREKKNKSLDSSALKSPTDGSDTQYSFKDDMFPRKCLSPVAILSGKERSRSNTPFFPCLDNIKETAIDASLLMTEKKPYKDFSELKQKTRLDDNVSIKESKLTRPKSYPIKNLDSFDESENLSPSNSINKENESREKNSQKESKLMRPKSYPASSPSPEKVYVSRNVKKEEPQSTLPTVENDSSNVKHDVEVSFSITLPKKKLQPTTKLEPLKNMDNVKSSEPENQKSSSVVDSSLNLKKYKVIKNEDTNKTDQKEIKREEKQNGSIIVSNELGDKNTVDTDAKVKITEKKEDVKTKLSETQPQSEKKGTIKKKIIRKVSSKSKADLGSNQEINEAKSSTEKKKVTKKPKDKVSEDGTKATVTKKKSVLQSIGHKLEKLASTKSASPEKITENNVVASDTKSNIVKSNRAQREQSVPVTIEPLTESNLIKRAVTLTDVATLENQNLNLGKTTVSKVLGLFKKFEPKEKGVKSLVDKSPNENLELSADISSKNENSPEDNSEPYDSDKPKRPTSLLLNGLSRKNKYGKTTSDSVSVVDNDDQAINKKEEPKNLRNSLKLDFSRLPRVKKIVPTDPVIEPLYMNVSSEYKKTETKENTEQNGSIPDINTTASNADSQSRSRSRSRSTISNSEMKYDLNTDYKYNDYPMSPSDSTVQQTSKNHESITPEKEDIVDRIRRKSFYSRFNEKKQRRKSSLVGPGAVEYDPVARIHSPPTETKFDASPTSSGTYDLSPGFSVASDLSPSTERYRSLLTDLPVSTRNNLRFDSHGLNDKIDTYRSLDRSDFRKYPGSRSYLDYDQPTSYGTHRYSRTKSLLDSGDGTEDSSLGILRDPHKYNRTISMYSPGSYATYRPKRTRNSAIILKESEKEPSPENILDKIRQRKKISISVTRKPDPEKDPLPRSNNSSKGEGDGAECSEKID